MEDDPLGIGIVSIPRMAIAPVGGVIGILLAEQSGEACIEQVMPKFPRKRWV